MSRCSSAVEQSFVLYRVHLVLTFPKLQHLAVHLCVFFLKTMCEKAHKQRQSVDVMDMTRVRGHRRAHRNCDPTVTHSPTRARTLFLKLGCYRKYTEEAHTPHYSSVWQQQLTHTNISSLICLRTALSLTASTLPPNRNVFGAVRHNNREDNLLVVLRQLFRQVSQIIWAFVLAPQSLPHFNHSKRKLDYIMIS